MTDIFKNQAEKQLFLSLQEGIDISEKPLTVIAQKLGISEKEILEIYYDFKKRGLIRRFGAVFEPSKIGYKSLLCAAKSDNPEKLREMVKGIKEITHCYTREYEYNVWFTFTAIKANFEDKLNSLRPIFDSVILELSAVKKFKTQVIFNLGLSSIPQVNKHAGEGSVTLNESDLALTSSLYDIDLSSFFLTESDIARLKYWKSAGALKRIALVPYHREIGYKANAMCIWSLERAEIEHAGNELKKRPSITHCYERKSLPGKFEYNFFAMLHSYSFEALNGEFLKINRELNLKEGRMLITIKEIKKTSFYP